MVEDRGCRIKVGTHLKSPPRSGNPQRVRTAPGPVPLPLAGSWAGPTPGSSPAAGEDGALRGILEGLERHVVLPVVTLIFPWDRGLPNGQELLIPRSGPLSSQDLRDIAEPRPGNGLGCWVARDTSSGITREQKPALSLQAGELQLPSIPELPPALPLPPLEGLRPEGIRGKPLYEP